MKNLFLAFLIIVMVSCESTKEPQKEYTFQVQYLYQGRPSPKLDTIKWVGYGDNKFFLERGDLMRWDHRTSQSKAIVSGISWFKPVSIIDMSTGQSLQIK